MVILVRGCELVKVVKVVKPVERGGGCKLVRLVKLVKPNAPT